MTDELFSVAGKRVFITGGASGIGRMISEGLAERGARVFTCSRKQAALDELVGVLKGKRGFDVHAEAADLGKMEDIDRIARRAGEHFGGELDVLINNAGATWGAEVEEYPESGWDKVFDLNVKGVFFLTQALMPLLEASARSEEPARIINIGSIDAFHVPTHETYAYTSSKAAVHQLSKHLALKLAPSHITVNVIAPGRYRSQILENAIELEGADEMLAPIPLKRFAEGPDLAGAAIYLASRAGSFVTGAVLPVDGGHATTL
jgi:NAD(P)-dependent dehydrogenase (short-subunit alcohol dehydrogenase family)